MRLGIVSLLIVFSLSCIGISCTAQKMSPHHASSNSASATPEEVLKYINKYRSKKGLSPLTMNSTISESARKHSHDMAMGRVPFGHDGFDERMGYLMKALAPAHASAENVAYGNLSAKEVVDVWIHSPGHRKNIEGNYDLTGIGIVPAKNGTLYFTQIFISHK